jgi:hypothetical protein
MTERYEYYWLNGRLVEFVNRKRGQRGRWPHSRYHAEQLVLTVQRVGKRNAFTLGPQETPDRAAEAILRYSRYFSDTRTPDIGSIVPRELREEVSRELADIARRVARQFEGSGNEEGQSGMLSGLANEVGTRRVGEWEVTIRTQVFSPQTKEPRVGADMGIIVDIRQGANRVVKAALIQAKRAEEPVDSPMGLPDIERQMRRMRHTTKESYVLVYSDEETFVVTPDQPDYRIHIEGFFSDIIECRRGDRAHRAVAQAYDRSATIDVTLATAGQ